MGNISTSHANLATSRDSFDAVAGDDDELRVLTALIGCIMVAEDADRHHGRHTSVHHLAPPAPTKLAKAG